MTDPHQPHQPYQPYPADAAQREDAAAAAPTQVEQPASIRTAVLLMRIGAAVGAVYLILTLALLNSLKDNIRSALEQQNSSVTQSQLDAAYQAYLITVIAFGVLGVALWLWMASANGKGKNWARITATVLGSINILISVLSLAGAGSATPLAVVFSLLNLVIAISALVFMYRTDSKRYYASMSRR